MFPTSSPLLLAALTLLSTTTSAHSWTEQMALIGPSGKYVGAYGYPRGYMARTDPGFDGQSMLWLMPSLASGRPRIDATDPACHTSQRTQNQTAKYPRLKAAPGSAIAMKYLENGHVTLPENQPGKPAPSRGAVYVFGTTSPKTDEKLATILAWNTAGTGGDKRGRLLASNNYDDGRCYQINGGPLSTSRQSKFPNPIQGQPGTKNELWCESNIVLPTDPAIVPPGKTLTLYWVWDWPTEKGTPGVPEGKDEYYTTCADVDVVAKAPDGPLTNQLPQQDPMLDAVKDFKNRKAQDPVPRGQKNAPVPAPAPAAPAPADAAPVATSKPVPAPTSLVTMTTARPVASSPPNDAGKIAINTKLAPGQGLLVGKDGFVYSYKLPTDGGAGAIAAAGEKVKRDIDPEYADENAEKVDAVERVAREVAGSHRFRIPRGGSWR